MKGSIVYRFETPIYLSSILYVNLIQKYSCINNCRFCGRPRNKRDIEKPNIYEKKAKSFLYLEKSPKVETVLKEINKKLKKEDKEIAFVGLGEPLIYLSKIIDVTKKLKKKYPNIKIRVDTNGATKAINENPLQVAKSLEKAGLDEIRVSVNAINKEEYNKLCRPKFKDSFNNLIRFVRTLNESKIDTYISFVVGFSDKIVKTRPKKDYIKFAKKLGINKKKIILRNYIDINIKGGMKNGNSKRI